MKIKIGTRKSKLALWQAENIAEKLQSDGIETELITMETKGDKVLDVSISKIGSKGVFTEELEEQLVTGQIDIAVHSAKDMQSSLPDGFEIIAFTEREKVNDVIISHKEVDLQNPDLVLGTSSTRRVALFKRFYPQLRIVDMRGNLQTRISKMERGDCDALVLAYAGVHRMGYDHMIQKELSLEEFTPAVGQGSIAIEAHSSLDAEKRNKIRESLNDADTENLLLAEREFLKTLDGGCSIPVYGLAKQENGEIHLKGGIVSLDGSKMVENQISGTNPATMGKTLGESVLEAGGADILKSIRENLS